MATEQDLTGLGIPPAVALLLGLTPQTLAGTGTTQATAAAILKAMPVCTAASSNTGVILPAGAAVGTPYFVVALGSTALVVYCPVGHTLNGTTNGKATYSASPGLAIFIKTGSTTWVTQAAVTTTVA